MNVLGSWDPVVRDEYYHSKREAGLIGRPEEYMSGEDDGIEAYIDSVVAARG